MSFCLMEGERYRIHIDDFLRAERQLSDKFTRFTSPMSKQEYDEYILDLKNEASDYWFAIRMGDVYNFGFMSNIDAMGFKLRWEE